MHVPKHIKKELLKSQQAEKTAKQKAKTQQVIDDRDQTIFDDAMSGVAPLKHVKVHHDSSKPLFNLRKQTDKFKEQTEINDAFALEINDPLSDELEVEEVDKEATLSFCRSGIQKSVFRKLRTGNYRISDELDLHGATIKQAKQILVYYLQEAVQFEGCCIRIIHGKGHRSGNNKPVLKTYVNHWLSEHDRVLAFHSSKPKDGGTGAVYVLLKTNKV